MSAVDLQIIRPDWPAPPGVRAAFTLRTGGVSVAPYDSLNLGARIGDSLEAVAENRRRVRETLQLPAEPVWLEQVHGIEVVELDGAGALGGAHGVGSGGSAGAALCSGKVTPRARTGIADTAGLRDTEGVAGDFGVGGDAVIDHAGHVPPTGDASVERGAGQVCAIRVAELGVPPTGDASVARGAGQVCAIRVADCMPVLFAAHDGSVVGAAHAGWRGLAGGVLEATIGRLGVPAAELIAWMGPAIGPKHFEVGEDVRGAFTARDVGAASAFVANARGRWQCDLYELARRRLNALGVSGIYGGGWCTFAEADRFFSYRRDRQCGRMAALIWIEPGRG
jgi:YfiH family protein